MTAAQTAEAPPSWRSALEDLRRRELARRRRTPVPRCSVATVHGVVTVADAHAWRTDGPSRLRHLEMPAIWLVGRSVVAVLDGQRWRVVGRARSLAEATAIARTHLQGRTEA